MSLGSSLFCTSKISVSFKAFKVKKKKMDVKQYTTMIPFCRSRTP